MWNRYSVRRRARRFRQECRFERAISFDPTFDLPQIFTGVSRRCFSWSRCGITNRRGGGLVAPDQSTGSKGHNFGSDCWISLKFSLEFPDAVFLRVDVESLLGEEVSSLQARIPVRKGNNFGSDVGSPSNFHRSFRTLVFHGVDAESLLGEEEVSLLETSVPV
jgi:hypothetical protein